MNAYARVQDGVPAGDVDSAVPTIRATPFKWINPRDIEPREFVYARHYTRKFLSASVAHAGIGKSGLIMVEGRRHRHRAPFARGRACRAHECLALERGRPHRRATTAVDCNRPALRN